MCETLEIQVKDMANWRAVLGGGVLKIAPVNGLIFTCGGGRPGFQGDTKQMLILNRKLIFPIFKYIYETPCV